MNDNGASLVTNPNHVEYRDMNRHVAEHLIANLVLACGALEMADCPAQIIQINACLPRLENALAESCVSVVEQHYIKKVIRRCEEVLREEVLRKADR